MNDPATLFELGLNSENRFRILHFVSPLYENRKLSYNLIVDIIGAKKK